MILEYFMFEAINTVAQRSKFSLNIRINSELYRDKQIHRDWCTYDTRLYIHHAGVCTQIYGDLVVRSTRAPGPSCEVLGYRKGTTTV